MPVPALADRPPPETAAWLSRTRLCARASSLLSPDDRPSRQRTYERVLRLVDLTVEVQTRRAFRRELLRWRDLVAALYIAADADPDAHRAAFRCLLGLRPAAWRQTPFV